MGQAWPGEAMAELTFLALAMSAKLGWPGYCSLGVLAWGGLALVNGSSPEYKAAQSKLLGLSKIRFVSQGSLPPGFEDTKL